MIPLSKLISSIRKRDANNHDLRLYADAFEDSGFEAQSVIAIGSDSLVIRLGDSNVLKLTTRTTMRVLEPFDLPVIDAGFKNVDNRRVSYVVQPFAEPATLDDFAQFLKTLTTYGYSMSDPGIAQIGVYKGEVKLLDQFAVVKNNFL